ncbi:MAG: hypothetical protein H6513_10220 [Acidimicrobiaceae bacterium]|nr:hypothetical protein [Ilumatobacter sp.]MCB9381051.1 hypothetical protein [Acidimicrobiaceae bacterium]MCO5330747.1 hypothetical protein [Ilumatobacteraceae bacterium]
MSTTHGWSSFSAPAGAPWDPPGSSPFSRTPVHVPPPYGTPPPGQPWHTGAGGASGPPAPKRDVWILVVAVLAVLAVLGAGAALVISLTSRGGTSDDGATLTNPPVTPTVPQTGTQSGTDLTIPGQGTLLGPVDVLDSFAFVEDLSVDWGTDAMTMHLQGQFVAPDRAICNTTVDYAGQQLTVRLTMIGDQVWLDDGSGTYTVTTPDDSAVYDLLASCPGTHQMWSEDFGTPPSGGVPDVIDGMAVLVYDVRAFPTGWEEMLGLPYGLTPEVLTVWTDETGTWVAGMQATVTGSAEAFRNSLGLPPDGVVGDCTMTFSLHVVYPNAADLAVVPPA